MEVNKKTNSLSKNGYTLMEILVVIGAFMIIILINLPLLQQYQPSLKLKSEAREMASQLRYAQQLTLTEQITHLVRFYPNAEKYEEKYELIKAEEGEDEVVIKEITLGSPISFYNITFTDDQVSFNTAGGSSEAGQVVLSNNTKTNIVEVKPSGYVKITY